MKAGKKTESNESQEDETGQTRARRTLIEPTSFQNKQNKALDGKMKKEKIQLKTRIEDPKDEVEDM